jgi:hypothetical protein
MNIDQLLRQSKKIWGKKKLNLSKIIIAMGVVYGDICRWERNAKKDEQKHKVSELKKELGNIIFATIRWCDDLGYDPKECIDLAIECQKKFEKR